MASLRPLGDVVHVSGTLPGPDDHCPCGSLRRARSCHMHRTGPWIATNSGALLTGPRTGIAHDRCYARSSMDCDGKITREHWLSAGVLKALAPLEVAGVPWLNGATRRISVPALQSKILCQRHNSALSPLDTTAEHFIRAVRDDEKALERVQTGDAKSGDDQNTLTIVSGPLWELWMLKLLLGGMTSGSFGTGDKIIESWAPDVDVANLIETLYYGGTLPAGAGMSIRNYQPDLTGTPDSVGVVPLSSAEQTGLIGVAIELGIVEISLVTVPARNVIRRRVGRIRLRRTNPTVEKIFAFAWDTANSEEITITKTT